VFDAVATDLLRQDVEHLRGELISIAKLRLDVHGRKVVAQVEGRQHFRMPVERSLDLITRQTHVRVRGIVLAVEERVARIAVAVLVGEAHAPRQLAGGAAHDALGEVAKKPL